MDLSRDDFIKFCEVITEESERRVRNTALGYSTDSDDEVSDTDEEKLEKLKVKLKYYEMILEERAKED